MIGTSFGKSQKIINFKTSFSDNSMADVNLL